MIGLDILIHPYIIVSCDFKFPLFLVLSQSGQWSDSLEGERQPYCVIEIWHSEFWLWSLIYWWSWTTWHRTVSNIYFTDIDDFWIIGKFANFRVINILTKVYESDWKCIWFVYISVIGVWNVYVFYLSNISFII